MTIRSILKLSSIHRSNNISYFLIERFRRRFQVRLQSIEGSMGNHLILVLISSITSWALRESWENWKLSWTIRFTLVLSMLRSSRRSFNFPNNETSLSLRHRLCDAFSAIFIFWRTEDELAHSSYFFSLLSTISWLWSSCKFHCLSTVQLFLLQKNLLHLKVSSWAWEKGNVILENWTISHSLFF